MSSSLDYTKHLRSVVRYNHENYSELLRWMETERRARDLETNPFVYVVDSQYDNTLKFYQYLGPGAIGSRLDELRAAIESPNSNTIHNRLVIINTRQRHLSPDLIDILGMAYDIEPQYFLSIVAEYEQYRYHLPTHRHVVAIPQSDADFIHLELIKPPGWAHTHNHAWIKNVRQEGHNMSIVILILSTAADELATRRARTALRPSETLRDPKRLVVENDHRFDGVSNIDTFLEELNVLSEEAIKNADTSPLNYIQPLIQGFEVMVGKAIQKLERRHQLWLLLEPAQRTACEDDELYSKWRDQRLCLENAASMTREVRRYVKRKGIGPTCGLESFLSPIEFLLQEGCTLDAHVRDQLSLHVGALSLEDSRKSIEESKRSIKQANAMGRITVLAFIFLPLSLVTSFFGMNVKEISGSGSSLKTFLIVGSTFEAATLVFWVLWLCANSVWEAAKRLRMKELQKLQKNALNREKERLNVIVMKREYFAPANLWRELRPKTWFQSAASSPRLPKKGDVYVSHLEGEL